MGLMPDPDKQERYTELTEAELARAQAEAEVLAAEARILAAENEERRATAMERIAHAMAVVDGMDEKVLGNLDKLYKAAAGQIAMDVLTGNVVIRHGDDAAKLVKELSAAGRLEAGESTSRVERVSTEEQVARVQQLRDEAARRAQEMEKSRTTTAAIQERYGSNVVPMTGA